MSETKEGALPAGWVNGHLGEVVEVIRGVTYHKEDSRKSPTDGLVPILRANNIQDTLVFEDLVYVPSSYISEEQMLQPGDTLTSH